MKKIVVAIVEDDAKIRERLSELIRITPDFELSGAYSNAELAQKAIPQFKPDVVLMDINLPKGSGIECTAYLKVRFPEMLIIIQTVYEEVDVIFRALRAGASGYIVKHAQAEELTDAIRDVVRGGAPMSSAIARKVVQSFHEPAGKPDPFAEISKREMEILQLLAKGHKNQEIADLLFISKETVRQHLHAIYTKLHVRSRTEAVIQYLNSSESR